MGEKSHIRDPYWHKWWAMCCKLMVYNPSPFWKIFFCFIYFLTDHTWLCPPNRQSWKLEVKYDGKLMGTRTTGYLLQYNTINIKSSCKILCKNICTILVLYFLALEVFILIKEKEDSMKLLSCQMYWPYRKQQTQYTWTL